MGWTYSHSWNSSSAMRDELRAMLIRNGHTIVKDALVAYGRRYYAAVKANDSGDISIFVALINGDKKDGDWAFGYKDMSESMGPCEVDCPLSVLDAADPVEKLYEGDSLEWATEWRAKVRAFWATKRASRETTKSVKVGDKVWFRNTMGNPFTVSRIDGKKYTGYDATNIGPYRLPMSRLEKVENNA